MKKHLLKIGISLIALFILAFSIYFLKYSGGANKEGTITLIVVNKNKQEEIHEQIAYPLYQDNKKTTLRMILEAHYEVRIESGMLMGINDVQVNESGYFLKLWINCTQAGYGIDQLPFNNGDVIMIVYTKVGDYSNAC